MTQNRRRSFLLVSIVWWLLLSAYCCRPSHALRRPSSSTHRPPSHRQRQQQQRRRRVLVKRQNNNNNKDGATTTTTTTTTTATTKSSVGASIFNLVNNVAGAGILALSAGMAKGTGYIPSVALCAILGLVSAHTFAMIGRACALLEVETFQDLWAETLGPDSTYIVDATIAILCLACCIIYSGILGDVLTPLLEQLPLTFNNRRSWNIVAVTVVALFPMSLIRDLSALAFTSILGFCAIAYTVLFILVRALDGSYRLGTGRFVQDMVAATTISSSSNHHGLVLPSFVGASWWNLGGLSSLVLASNLGLAYIAHYNAPTFYRSLHDATPERFQRMVGGSFSILIALYVVTMVAGYATFGDVCQGNLLLNYHPHDVGSTLARVATFASILFGFPLVATGARHGLLGALGQSATTSTTLQHVTLVGTMLTGITAIACTVQDVSRVMGLTGAALGSLIVYVFPAILYSRALGQYYGAGSPESIRARRESLWLVPFGVLIGGMGVYMTLSAS